MGADLLLAVVPVPIYENGEVVTRVEGIAAELGERIQKEIDQNRPEHDWLFDGPLQSYADVDDGESDVDICEKVWLCAAQVIDAITNWYRDVAVMNLDGKQWAFCGGTSWGDAPDEFDDWTVVAELGLFDKPFALPKEA